MQPPKNVQIHTTHSPEVIWFLFPNTYVNGILTHCGTEYGQK